MTTAKLTLTAYTPREYAATGHALAAAAHFVRNVALLAAAPFIALVYVVAAPFAGLAMLAWFAARAVKARAAA